MPGVYRDSSGGYSYQINNNYEDRRRRQLDDQYAGRPPFGPRAPDPRPPITWNPPPWPTTQIALPAAPVLQVPPDPGLTILLDLASDLARRENEALFDRLVGSLPNRVGENPAFDMLFEDPTVPTLSAAELLAYFEP